MQREVHLSLDESPPHPTVLGNQKTSAEECSVALNSNLQQRALLYPPISVTKTSEPSRRPRIPRLVLGRIDNELTLRPHDGLEQRIGTRGHALRELRGVHLGNLGVINLTGRNQLLQGLGTQLVLKLNILGGESLREFIPRPVFSQFSTTPIERPAHIGCFPHTTIRFLIRPLTNRILSRLLLRRQALRGSKALSGLGGERLKILRLLRIHLVLQSFIERPILLLLLIRLLLILGRKLAVEVKRLRSEEH